MALAAADTASACHYMRNYATALANNREYVKSNDLLRRVKRLMPAVGNHVMLQITFAENFLNLHQLDSARYYWNQAWANEQNHGGDKAEGFSVRSALVQLKTVLDYTSGTPLDIITFGRFADSVRVEMRDQNRVIEQSSAVELRADNQAAKDADVFCTGCRSACRGAAVLEFLYPQQKETPCRSRRTY